MYSEIERIKNAVSFIGCEYERMLATVKEQKDFKNIADVKKFHREIDSHLISIKNHERKIFEDYLKDSTSHLTREEADVFLHDFRGCAMLFCASEYIRKVQTEQTHIYAIALLDAKEDIDDTAIEILQDDTLSKIHKKHITKVLEQFTDFKIRTIYSDYTAHSKAVGLSLFELSEYENIINKSIEAVKNCIDFLNLKTPIVDCAGNSYECRVN